MEFKLEVDGYETIFAQYETYENIEKKRIVFNFLGLNLKEYEVFSKAVETELLVEKENSILSYRCIKEKIQFSVLLEKEKMHYFDKYKNLIIKFGFSAKSETGLQNEKVIYFEYE